jgi:hypothetical protein
MSDKEKTKLEAYADGQTMRKRQSPKRKKSKKQELGAKEKEATQKYQEEQHNVIFKPNEGTTDRLSCSR